MNIFSGDCTQYLISIEAYHSEQATYPYHLHAVLSFSIPWAFDEIRSYTIENFSGEELTLDVQSAKSLRNLYKYISKEDINLITNVSESKLNFNYQIHKWCQRTTKFSFCDPFIVQHRNYHNYIKNYFYEKKENLKNKDLKIISTQQITQWATKVQTWYNERLQNLTNTALYLYGKTGTGKSSLIESLINPGTCFHPTEGKFFLNGFLEENHKIILFEEFNIKKYDESYLKRLTENKPYSYPQKFQQALHLENPNIIIIFISNDEPNFSDALTRRLTIIEANENNYVLQTQTAILQT